MKMQKYFFKILLLTGLLLFGADSFSQNPNFHIYLCFGQSNMVGQGPIEAKDKVVDSRLKVLQAVDCSNISRKKGIWYTAIPPLCQCYSGLSPADYFGRTMVQNLPDSITVGIINVGVSGSDIRLFDKDLYQSYDSTYTQDWYLSQIKSYDGSPRKRLVDLAKIAQNDGVIKGILLHQGEANTGDPNWPLYVKKIYNEILADLSLRAGEVPLLAGEVLSVSGNCCGTWMNPIIDKLPMTIPTAHVISSNDLTGQDAAHFDSPSYREFGVRYATKMLSLLGNKITGIETDLENGLSIYPNPTIGELEIKSDKFQLNSVEIYDLAGKQVFNKKFVLTNHIKFNPQLQKGFYFLKLNNDRNHNIKIIVN